MRINLSTMSKDDLAKIIIKDEAGNVVGYLREVDTDEGWADQFQPVGGVTVELDAEGNITGETQQWNVIRIYGKFTIEHHIT